MRIVIADDHALFRGGLKLQLQEADGCAELIEASSFDQVLSMLGDVSCPDLVIIDLFMPGPSWQEALRRIREGWSAARVVILTADDTAEVAQEALSKGAHGFILKTEEPNVFIAAMKLIMSGGSYFPVSVLGSQPMKPVAGQADRTPQPVTERQREVLGLVASGCANKEIAWRLNLTEGTVKLHVAAILRALGASNRTQAVSIARACGII